MDDPKCYWDKYLNQPECGLDAILDADRNAERYIPLYTAGYLREQHLKIVKLSNELREQKKLTKLAWNIARSLGHKKRKG